MPSEQSSAKPEPLVLLYRDEHLVVVDKPSGLAVHRGLDRSRDHVVSRLHRQLGRWVWPSHRLDRATSGALALALTEAAATSLAMSFMRSRVDKRYLAWVRGVPEPRAGVIDHPVPRAEGALERVEALTEYETIAIADDPRTGNPRYGLVLCRPRTGRHHQLRRHLRHVHCPILGDTTYGDGKENRALRELAGLSRLALHAIALAVPHPDESDRIVRAVAAVPDDLRAPMARLGLTGKVLDDLERAMSQSLEIAPNSPSSALDPEAR